MSAVAKKLCGNNIQTDGKTEGQHQSNTPFLIPRAGDIITVYSFYHINRNSLKSTNKFYTTKVSGKLKKRINPIIYRGNEKYVHRTWMTPIHPLFHLGHKIRNSRTDGHRQIKMSHGPLRVVAIINSKLKF